MSVRPLLAKYRFRAAMIWYNVFPGYLCPFWSRTSWTNFVNQKFIDSAFISWSEVFKFSTFSTSISRRLLYSWEECTLSRSVFHSSNNLNAHLFLYSVVFGTAAAKTLASSSRLRAARKRLLGLHKTVLSFSAMYRTLAYNNLYTLVAWRSICMHII